LATPLLFTEREKAGQAKVPGEDFASGLEPDMSLKFQESLQELEGNARRLGTNKSDPVLQFFFWSDGLDKSLIKEVCSVPATLNQQANTPALPLVAGFSPEKHPHGD
jgi:hypothetical protein